MKNLIILIFAILTLDAFAVCTSPISRANNGANSVLTSAKYNLDINTVYNKVNTLPGDCIVDNSINGTKLIDASVTIDKMAANSIDTAKIVDGSVTAAKLAAAIDNLVPVGTILPFGGTVAPSGYLLCNGASVSRTTYARLYAVIGNAFGSADGVSFSLPDTRGLFLRGVDGGVGRDLDRAARTAFTGGNPGDAVGSYQTAQTLSHNHLSGPLYNPSGAANLAYSYVANGYAGGVVGLTIAASFTNAVLAYTSSVGGNETRPVNLNVNYIVKY